MDNTRTDISAYYIATNPDLVQSQTSNAFKFIVTGLDDLVDPITGNPITNATDILKESIFSFDPPSFTQQPITVRMGNTVCKTAGTPEFSDGTLQLHDFVGIDTYNVLYAWQARSFNIKTGRVGLAKDYKRTCYLLEYTPDFSKIVRVWKLYGVFITGLKKDGYDTSTNANEVKIQCSLSYDWAEPENPEQI